MEVTSIDERNIQIKIDSALYSVDVIYKCFYWYVGKCSVEISTKGKSFIVKLTDKKQEWDIQKIQTDLIDFKTREIISNETKNIREMLIAKAFAHNDEFDEIPPGEISDPVGFKP